MWIESDQNYQWCYSEIRVLFSKTESTETLLVLRMYGVHFHTHKGFPCVYLRTNTTNTNIRTTLSYFIYLHTLCRWKCCSLCSPPGFARGRAQWKLTQLGWLTINTNIIYSQRPILGSAVFLKGKMLTQNVTAWLYPMNCLRRLKFSKDDVLQLPLLQ